MVVCKIELWPHGVEAKKVSLGNILIDNDGTGTPQMGNYNVRLSHAGIYINKPGFWKTGKVVGYRRTLSPYHLIKMALNAVLRG